MKPKTCTYKSCRNPTWSNGRCKWHPEQKPKQKKRSPINPVSNKRLKELAEYRNKRRAFLAEHTTCQVLTCQKKSTDIHHMKGRTGDLFLDEKHWMAVCRTCHEWIERHPEESKRLGYSGSRLSA